MTKEIQTTDVPTVNQALRKWLSQQLSIRMDNLKADPGAIDDLWADYDRCGDAGMAFRVRQGFRLLQIKAINEESFEAGLKSRDIAHSTAYRDIELAALFNELGDIKLVGKASTLGIARIQELKPELGLEGMRALIANGEVNGLTYDQVSKMTKRDIVDWRRNQRQLRLRLRLAEARAAGLGDGEALKLGDDTEPREVTIGREEGLAIGWRIRAELALLLHISADLEPEPGTERGSAHFGAAALIVKSIDEIVHDAERLQDALIDKFGEAVGKADVLVGRDAKAAAMRKVWTAEVEEAAAERARERHQRYGWRGRPATRKAIPKKTGQRGRPRNGG